MILLENLLILAFFGTAAGFLIKKVASPFLKKSQAYSGCASCSSGSCSSISKLEINDGFKASS